MAAIRSLFLPLTTVIAALLLAEAALPMAAESHTFATKLPTAQKLMKKEKLTHLHFYWSNIRAGPNATALIVAPILNNATFQGTVALNDDALTLGPEASNSTSVGKALGMYFFPSDTVNLVYEMMYDFAFTHGDYNGSSLTLQGTVRPSFTAVSEISVAGGTGLFRFARGYAVVKLFLFDPLRNLVVNELDVYVSHY